MVSTTKIISTKTVMLGQFEDLRVLREENLKAVNKIDEKSKNTKKKK